jgi:hypothetical protein
VKRIVCWVAACLLVAPLRGAEPARSLDDAQLESMWKDLARDDDEGARRAWRSVRRMAGAPSASIPLLRARLKPVPEPDAKKITVWIEDLDSGDFNIRETATRELEQVGALAAGALKKKLETPLPSLEVRRRVARLLEKLDAHVLSSDELRQRRSVEVLFLIGTPEARTLVEELSRGASGATLTEDARRTLARMPKAAR